MLRSLKLHKVCVLLSVQLLLCGLASSNEGTVPSFAELKTKGLKASKYRSAKTSGEPQKAPTANLEDFRKRVQPILAATCYDCHGADTQEGNIRVDTLDPNLFTGDDVSWWLEVQAVITNGEMPPPDTYDLSDEDRNYLINWLATEIKHASAARRSAKDHSSFRRLTRYEYNYALQDLLGLPIMFGKDLPPEATSEDGFQNSSEMLHMSAMQFSAYRESARKALLWATVRGEEPQRLYWSASMQKASTSVWEGYNKTEAGIREKHKNDPEALERELAKHVKNTSSQRGGLFYKNIKTGQTGGIRWGYGGAKHAWKPANEQSEWPSEIEAVAVVQPGRRLIVELGDRVPDRGTMKVRASISRLATDEPIPSVQLEFGWQASNDSQAATRVSAEDLRIEAEPGKPEIYEWNVRLENVYPRNAYRNDTKLGQLPNPSELIKIVNSSMGRGTIQIDHVEVITPVFESWPPESHKLLFFESPNQDDEPTYAREILTRFMTRAWRREIEPEELDHKLKLFKTIRHSCEDFQDAMVEVLASVLSSPNFLYLDTRSPSVEPATDAPDDTVEQLTQFELASRLAMFIWCSTPDEHLLELAKQGKLSNSEVLSGEVERMLGDPRAERFSQHFVRQWLGMQLLDYLDVDKKVYPRFDRSLREAMQQEPIAFFQEVLSTNESLLDFLHADYTLVNERLAKHYGIEGVQGNHFRRIDLPADIHRGGLLTQAGLLAMNSDGKDSHPLKRGVWLLEKVLNDPPPPPPPAVPEIDVADPEIAKMTLKQRLEDHRDDPACYSCHSKIDPWGFAFENFDATGSYREQWKGQPVDSSSELFNGHKLDGMEGLKRYLIESRQDQFVGAMVHKLTTYALGRPLTFEDRASTEKITEQLRQQGDGLATLVKLIATSDIFQQK